MPYNLSQYFGSRDGFRRTNSTGQWRPQQVVEDPTAPGTPPARHTSLISAARLKHLEAASRYKRSSYPRASLDSVFEHVPEIRSPRSRVGSGAPSRSESFSLGGARAPKGRQRFRDTVRSILRMRSGRTAADMSHSQQPGHGSSPHQARRQNQRLSNGVALRNGSSGSDAQESGHHEDNHPASVESLVRRCAESFDAEGNCRCEDFPRILLLTHLWFMTSEQLIVLFTQLFEEESTACDAKKSVFFAIQYWLKEFPHMFDLDHNLVCALRDLQELAANDPDVDPSTIDLRNKGSYKWMSAAHMSIRPNQVNRKRRKVSLVFTHLEPEELAIHISYLEYKSFRRLTLSDFHNYAVHGVIKDNLKLERAVFLFNNITHWVQCMVLDHNKPQERADAIVKFVAIAKKLHAMRNFNTLMAIVGALTHTAIARMKKTMSVVPKDTLKTLDELVELLDSKANYCAYRRAYQQITNEFKIPVVGILMKDLIALHAAYPDRVGDELINVRKMMMIGGIFQELTALQRTPFPYEVNRDLVNTLRVSLYLNYSEEEIYQLSVVREPRDVKHSTSGNGTSPSRFINMGFAEFARYTCQLDRETIKEHVNAMVQSVFKAYDLNADGFISEAEFESFIQNFPGLDSFATVDKDQDGRISMAEMLDYFLKISSTRRNEFTQSFKHDFVETSYFHPTFCEECEKLLWGLVKQGWKCKDCGINCHKHCKGRIVQECRPKSSARNGSVASQSQALAGSGKKHEKSSGSGARDKSSVSSESDMSANGDGLGHSGIHAVIEDEAFEIPQYHVKSGSGAASGAASGAGGKSSQMKRSTSLAAADVHSTRMRLDPGGEHRKAKLSSKTPPPVRKASSPILSAGNMSLQRKMHNFMISKKRSSVKRAVNDAGTQTPQGEIPGAVAADDAAVAVSSFLYGKAPVLKEASVKQEPSMRLGSTGEELSDERPSDAEGESPPPASRADVTTPLRTRGVHGEALLGDDRGPAERRDSGLSGCSCVTSASASTSAPATPHSLDANGAASQFSYPAQTTGHDADGRPHARSAKNNVNLASENARLRKENEQLKDQLTAARQLIMDLQAKLHVTATSSTMT